MKTGLSPYDGQENFRPHKRQRIEPQITTLPSEIWSVIIFESIKLDCKNAEASLANLNTVCQNWNELCKDVKVQLCQQVAFDSLFCLPSQQDLSKVDERLRNALLSYCRNDIGAIWEDHIITSHLTSRALNFLQISGSKLQSLSFLNHLSERDLTTVLKFTPHLHSLALDYPTDGLCKIIGQATQLKSLSTDLMFCSDAGLGHLINLPLLEKLRVQGFGAVNLSMISQLTNLTYLKLMGGGDTDEELLYLTTLQNLKKLHIAMATPESWDFISKLSQLEVLCFSRNDGDLGVEDRALSSICQLTKLRRLGLDACDFTEEGVKHLIKLTSLTSLNLSLETPLALDPLHSLPLLQKLELNGAGAADLSLLSRLTNLVQLKLSGIREKQGLLYLTSLQKLKYLSLDVEYPHLLDYLPRLDELKSLCIRDKSYGKNIFKKDMLTICNKLMGLQKLHLVWCNLEDTDFSCLDQLKDFWFLNKNWQENTYKRQTKP